MAIPRLTEKQILDLAEIDLRIQEIIFSCLEEVEVSEEDLVMLILHLDWAYMQGYQDFLENPVDKPPDSC